MNRKLNIKLLLALFLGSIAFLVTVYFVHGYQVNKNADGLLIRAEKAKEAGDLANSLTYLRRYLVYRRDDYEQLSQYALDMRELLESESSDSVRERFKTYATIEQALLKLQDSEDREQHREMEEKLRLASVEFAMKFGPLTTAVDHLDYLIQQQGEDADPELQLKLARCKIALGDQDEGLGMLRELIGFNGITGEFTEQASAPDNIDAYFLLALTYRRELRDADTAEKVLARMVEVNSDSFDAYLKRCAYWRLMGELFEVQARADMEKALELGSDEPNVLATAAGIELDDDNLGRAKSILDRAIETLPDEEKVPFFRLLAAWAAKSNEYDQARQYVADGLELAGRLSFPDDRQKAAYLKSYKLELVWYRANLELGNNDVSEVKKTLAELEEMEPPPRAYITILEAQIAMAEGGWQDAVELFQRVRPDLARGGSHLLTVVDRGLAQCYSRLNQPDKMLAVYENLVAANPEDQAVAWGLIRTQLMLNRVDEASKTYRRLEEDLEQRGEELDASGLTDLLRLRTAQQLQLSEEDRNWTETDRVMARIVKEPSITRDAQYKLAAELLKRKGQTEGAERLLDKAREEFGGDLSFRLAEVEQTFRESGFDAAWSMLDSLQAEFGDSVRMRGARSSLIIYKRGPEVKQRLLALEGGVDSFSNQEKVALWGVLAYNYHYVLNDREEAGRLYRQIAELDPRDIKSRTALIQLAMDAVDRAEAADDTSRVADGEEEVNERMTELRQLTGRNDAQYKATDASRLLWQVRREKSDPQALRRARSLVSEARRSRPNWDRLALIEAEINRLEKDTDAAVEVLRRASESGASSKNVTIQLARLLFGQEKDDEARKVLERLPQAERARVADALQRSMGQSVAGTPDSTDPDELIAQAGQLILAQKWDEADSILRAAVNAGPARMDTWFALVRFLLSRNRADEAEDVVREAQLQLPEYMVPLFAGQCYEMIPGNAEQALQFYTRAHSIAPDDLVALRALASFHLSQARQARSVRVQKERLGQARDYLQKLLETAQRDSKTSDPQAAWAQRETARLTAASGHYSDYLKAVELVGQNVDADGVLDSEDTQALGELAARRNEGSSRMKTIQMLESVEADRPLIARERGELAELYFKTDQKWDKCRELMEQLISEHPNDLSIRLLWIDWLLQKGEVDGAEQLLAGIEPATPQSKILDAKRLVLQGRAKQAGQVLRSLMPEKLPSDKDEARILLQVAKITEGLARDAASLYGPAETLYRAFAKRNPAGKLPLALFLGRRGGEKRLQEAFQLCDQATADQRLETVIQAALTIMGEYPGTLAAGSNYWSQLSSWIDKARQQAPELISPVLQQATLAESRNKLQDAETLYRQLLDRSDIDARNRAIVSNNLAYLLALGRKGADALPLVEEAVSQLGPMDDVLDTRAVVRLARNEPKLAKQDLQTIISGGSKSPETYFHLAQAEQMLGETESARKALQRAVELGLSVGRVKPVERPGLERLSRELGVDLGGNGGGST